MYYEAEAVHPDRESGSEAGLDHRGLSSLCRDCAVCPGERHAPDSGIIVMLYARCAARTDVCEMRTACPHNAQRLDTPMQLSDADGGTVDDTAELIRKIGLPLFPQTAFRFLGREPGGIPVRLLRRIKPGHGAEISVGRDLNGWSSARIAVLAPDVTHEGSFFDAAMNPGFLESLERGGLRVGEACFRTALGKNPASTTRLHQQKLNRVIAYPITDGGDLLASPKLAKL